VIVSYFAEFDYLTTVIKKIFLREETDEKFYAKFINKVKPDNKTKKNFCQDLFNDQIGAIKEEDLKKYQEVRR